MAKSISSKSKMSQVHILKVIFTYVCQKNTIIYQFDEYIKEMNTSKLCKEPIHKKPVDIEYIWTILDEGKITNIDELGSAMWELTVRVERMCNTNDPLYAVLRKYRYYLLHTFFIFKSNRVVYECNNNTWFGNEIWGTYSLENINDSERSLDDGLTNKERNQQKTSANTNAAARSKRNLKSIVEPNQNNRQNNRLNEPKNLKLHIMRILFDYLYLKISVVHQFESNAVIDSGIIKNPLSIDDIKMAIEERIITTIDQLELVLLSYGFNLSALCTENEPLVEMVAQFSNYISDFIVIFSSFVHGENEKEYFDNDNSDAEKNDFIECVSDNEVVANMEADARLFKKLETIKDPEFSLLLTSGKKNKKNVSFEIAADNNCNPEIPKQKRKCAETNATPVPSPAPERELQQNRKRKRKCAETNATPVPSPAPERELQQDRNQLQPAEVESSDHVNAQNGPNHRHPESRISFYRNKLFGLFDSLKSRIFPTKNTQDSAPDHATP